MRALVSSSLDSATFWDKIHIYMKLLIQPHDQCRVSTYHLPEVRAILVTHMFDRILYT